MSSITPKKKTCKTCKQQAYIFSKGDCKSCAQKRYTQNSQLKAVKINRKPISKKPTERHKENKEAELTAMLEFWEEHADFDGGCGCFECSRYLFFDRTHVAHILSKGAFPQCRTDKRNFMILCLKCHDKFDCVDRTKMKVWPYCEEIILELKIAA